MEAHEELTVGQRRLGRISCWGALILGLVYTVFQVLHKLYNATTAEATFRDPYLPAASLLLVPIAALMISAWRPCMPTRAESARSSACSRSLSWRWAWERRPSSTSGSSSWSRILPTAGAPWLSLFLPIKIPCLYGELDLVNWSWFFSLSMISAAPIFREGRLERTLSGLMYATGILPILGWALMIFVPSAYWPGWILQALGWGVLILVVWFLMARVFDGLPAYRLRRTSVASSAPLLARKLTRPFRTSASHPSASTVNPRGNWSSGTKISVGAAIFGFGR